MIKTVTSGVAAEYVRALSEYLQQPSEAALSNAARLGRMALVESTSVLDIIMIHHAALGEALRTGGGPDPATVAQESALFLCEALSSFEMTLRGYRDASEANVRMVQFALIVCHELRSPLTSIVSSVGMLQEILDTGRNSAAVKLAANIARSAEILRSRTDDLQDLAGFRAGTLSLRPVAVEAGPLLRGVVQRMEPLAARAGVTIGLEIAPKMPRFTADPDRIDQVVSNLVHNALKYAADGKRVDVRCFAREGLIVILVQDYGPGIDAATRMKLFQLRPGAGQKSDDVAGMGIGLALCRELVELHGGGIDVTSQEGKGCVLAVTLPVSRKSPGEGKP